MACHAPTPAMQLNFFDHGRDLMLRNDVLAALEQREPAAARAAWRAFGDEYPQDATLAPLALLVDALEDNEEAGFPSHDALRARRLALIEHIEPAALRLFGDAQGAVWLAPLWRRTAQRAARLTFRADRAEDHAAPLWLHAGDPASSAAAVAGIESWRRIPVPLAWMAEARQRSDGLDSAWPLLAELAWLAPARFDELTRRLTDPRLAGLRRHFDAGFEGDGSVADLAWLPAWALVGAPVLAPRLRKAQPVHGMPAELAMRLLLELLNLERHGRHAELVQRRKALRDLNASLYGAYMATR